MSFFRSQEGKIAYVSNRTGYREIFVMNTDGTYIRQLTHFSSIAYHPAWSPDGTRIAFEVQKDGTDDIYVMNADGSNITQITHNLNANKPTWSPDGQKLAFEVDKDGYGPLTMSKRDIYVINIDGTNLKRLTSQSDNDLMNGIWLNSKPAWSPNGDNIAFVSHDKETSSIMKPIQIYIMNSDGSGLKKITNYYEMACCNYPAWSPDGKKLCYSYNNYDIYSINIDGTGLIKIASNGAEIATWSKDGNKIAYHVETTYNKKQLFITDYKTLLPIQITTDYSNECPSWQHLRD